MIQDAGLPATVISAPVTSIDATIEALDLLQPYEAIFTSRNGVRFAPDAAGDAWCVGDKTAEDASLRGWNAKSVGGTVDDLFQRICADQKLGEDQKNFVHFCGEETRGALVERLQSVGIKAEKRTAYRQRALPLSDAAKQALLTPNPPIIPLFSPNSARRLVDQLPTTSQADFVIISHQVSRELPESMTRNLVVAEEPNARSILKGIATLYGEIARD